MTEFPSFQVDRDISFTSQTSEMQPLDERSDLIKSLVVYRPKLVEWVATRCNDRALAEDLVQQTFEKLQKPNTQIDIKNKDNPFSFLCLVALNLLRDQKRKEAKYQLEGLDETHHKIGAENGNPESLLLQQEHSNEAREFFKKLTPEQQLVFILQYREGLTAEQIAAKLKITQSRVNYQKRLIRQAVQEFYKK